MLGQPIVPLNLVGAREVRVCAARIWNEINAGCADAPILQTQPHVIGRLREYPVNVAIAGDAVKTGD